MVYPPVLSKKITILMQCKASGRWQPPQPTYKASTHLTSRLRKVTALANTHGLISTHGATVFLTPDAKTDLHVQSHGFSTAAGVPAHAQSINTPNFTFAQGDSPGEYTRAHLDRWGASFSRPDARKDFMRSGTALDCDSRPNPRTQPQHTCLHVCARLQQPWRAHTASSR